MTMKDDNYTRIYTSQKNATTSKYLSNSTFRNNNHVTRRKQTNKNLAYDHD